MSTYGSIGESVRRHAAEAEARAREHNLNWCVSIGPNQWGRCARCKTVFPGDHRDQLVAVIERDGPKVVCKSCLAPEYDPVEEYDRKERRLA